MTIERAHAVVDRFGTVVMDVGFDSVGPKDKLGRYLQAYESITFDLLVGSVDNYIWTPQDDGVWTVQFGSALYTTAGGASAALQIVVCPGAVAIASGTAQFTAAFDLTTAGPGLKHGTLIASPTPMVKGDLLGVDFSGTLTALVGKAVVGVRRIG